MARGKRSHSARAKARSPIAVPTDFLARLDALSASEKEQLEQAFSESPPVSLRVNPRKALVMEGDRVPWCTSGWYLAMRPTFTLDPLLHAGAYYVQEASSMLIEQAVTASGCRDRDVLALDLCAAPGGKSTHLLSLLSPNSLLVANEVEGARRRILQENLWKWGAINVVVTGSKPEALAGLEHQFDLVLVDAPCSGEGMFRKDEEARQQWSPRLVERCASTQADLLPLAWEALSPGGHLVYSTCTWEAMENEMQVERLINLGGECIELPLDPTWGVVRSTAQGTISYRCYPHRLRGEGFFLALVRKPGETGTRKPIARHSAHKALPWLRNDLALDLVERNGLILARPAAWSHTIDNLALQLRAELPGIPVAERKGDEWHPHAAAALSEALDGMMPARVELKRDDALRYLRGEALPAPEARGLALAWHNNAPLGWMQGAGNRWNSRWPAPWRIRITRRDLPPVPWARP